MKMKLAVIAVLVGFISTQVVRAAVAPSSPMLSPGRYAVTIMPPFNQDVAARIKDRLKKIDAIREVDMHSSDSLVSFTVKDNALVNMAELRKAVEAVDAGAVMTTPYLEHTLTAGPGL